MGINAARFLSSDPTLSLAARFTRMLLYCTGGETGLSGRNATQRVSLRSSKPYRPSPPPTASMDSLPNELVLNICSYLSPSELWFSARPTSRQFYSCAKDVLIQKCFHEEQVHFSRCCFWCSLGHSPLETVLRTITPLFSDKQKLRIAAISDQALLAKLAFGGLCNRIARFEQKISVSVGGGEEVTITAAEWLRYVERLPCDRQVRRYGFLAFYFARVGKKAVEWRVTEPLWSVAHVLGFVVVGIVIVATAVSVLVVGGAIWEACRLAQGMWSFLDRLAEACIPDRLTRD